MSRIVITTFDVQETVGILRKQLGPVFDWNNRLQDMRRGKVHSGPMLLPVALRKHKSWWRPVYEMRAIAVFIVEYLKYDENARADVPLFSVMLEGNTADLRAWYIRRLEEASASVAARPSMSSATPPGSAPKAPPATAASIPTLTPPVSASVAAAVL